MRKLMKCKNFVCEMRKTCLFEGRCDDCKIEPHTICVFKNACDYARKERLRKRKEKDNESKIRSGVKSNSNARH